MCYIIKKNENGLYSLVTVNTDDGSIVDERILIEENTLDHIHAFIESKQKYMETLVEVACHNPNCSNHILMTAEQKRDMLIAFHKKYDKLVLPFCCKECRDETMRMLRGEI